MFSFIGWIIIGGLAGWLASMVMGRDQQQGMLGNIILGIVGAFVGGLIVYLMTGAGDAGYQGFNLPSLIIAFLGAIAVLFIKQMVTGRR